MLHKMVRQEHAMEEVQRHEQALQAKVKQALQAARAAQPAARGHAAERELARLRCALPGEQARRAAA